MLTLDGFCDLVVPFVMTYWVLSFFFFNDTATTEIYTLSLHDALPISGDVAQDDVSVFQLDAKGRVGQGFHDLDRKSTRLNSSHSQISYAVFCLKKKKKINRQSVTDKLPASSLSDQCHRIYIKGVHSVL